MNIIHCDNMIILIINYRFRSQRYDIIYYIKYVSIVANYRINYSIYKSYTPDYE
jgi:hypothetical protein